jgi:ketosteroid isomerase-like protein
MATTTAAPSVASIAEELVTLCRAGKNLEAVEKFYAPTVVTVEAAAMPNMPAEMTGIQAVRDKHAWWDENNELHGTEVNGPYLGRDQFAVQYTFDTTFKPTGRRQKMSEMALYTVKDGKIVHERFFYNAAGGHA